MPGHWTPLAHPPPFAASTMLLLTDGTVMCQEAGGKNWWRLTPTASGDYIHGTWSPLSAMANTRLYYASAVLADGRVFVAGGEYSDAGSDTNKAEIYDPVMDSWTSLTPPAGWTQIGDAPCCVLPDGRLLLGSIGSTATALYDPTTNTWAAAANKDDPSSEETWTLLPDETVLAAECTHHPKAEKYLAAADRWISAGNTAVDLVQASSIEIGPALLLPDGRVFAIGASGHTALYTPPALASHPGTWAAGPDFPLDTAGQRMEAKDAPGCLLPNGHVLCTASPAAEGGTFPSPTSFFEFDGHALLPVASPTNAGGPAYVGRMLLVPTGQVLFAAESAEINVYTPTGGPDPAWHPQITSSPASVQAGHSYSLTGRQINGLSQAVSYGDDASAATNYPLVRIRNLNSGHVWYCRTFDHSSMGVATGLSTQSTTFKVPFGIEHGPAELCLVANGISSACVALMVTPFVWRIWPTEEAFNRLIGSLADGPLWVLGPNGPVPVDPWGPLLGKRARAAYAKITAGVKELQTLGAEVIALRMREQQQAAAPRGLETLSPPSLTGIHLVEQAAGAPPAPGK